MVRTRLGRHEEWRRNVGHQRAILLVLGVTPHQFNLELGNFLTSQTVHPYRDQVSTLERTVWGKIGAFGNFVTDEEVALREAQYHREVSEAAYFYSLADPARSPEKNWELAELDVVG